MNTQEVISRIRKLNIPQKAKAELLLLWTRARRLVEGILRFICRHRQFGEALLMGAILAYLLSHAPYIGTLLACTALITAAAIGVMKELREDLNQLFADLPAEA